MDLIASLISESGVVHLRRAAVSLLVYITLMIVVIFLPLSLLQHFCQAVATILPIATSSSSPLPSTHTLYFSYILPAQLQIPLELLICHVSFLALLDKHKDLVGRCQHVWFVYWADKLGVTRFIIPLPLLPAEGTAVTDSSSSVINSAVIQQQSAEATVAATPAMVNHERGEDDLLLPRVGRPLQRPPQGWDIRSPIHSVSEQERKI